MEARMAPTYSVGQELPAISRQITLDKISRYADASGDHNPLHVDPEFAAATRFGGPIAHGMLVLAYVSEALTAAFGEEWLGSGRIKARFRGPARPGDTLTVRGHVVKVDGSLVTCVIEARNQADEVLISADAQVGA